MTPRPTLPPPPADGSSTGGHRSLHLVALRLVWAALSVFSISIFVISLPEYFTYLQTVCMASSCVNGELTSLQVQALDQLGISLTWYAVFFVVLSAISGVCWCAIAIVLFWRGSDNWMTLFAALTLVMFGLVRFPDAPTALAAAHSYWWLPVEGMRFLGSACLSFFCYLFPTGKFVPRWTSLVAVLWLIPQIPEFFWPASPWNPELYPPWLQAVGFSGFVLSVVVAQTYRYRYVYTPVQRQQTKWVIWGLVVALIGFLTLTFLLPLAAPGNAGSLLRSPYIQVASYGVMLLVPLSLAIAILRHRLYDIDLLINRTLVYGSLTGILTLIYLAGVVGLQSLVNHFAHTSQESPLVIVASTLLIAALFQPLRRRVQTAIDRRFYRRKYDAAQILEQFAANLQNEVDLSTIGQQLMVVVEETMQPVQISLWLRPRERHDGTGI